MHLNTTKSHEVVMGAMASMRVRGHVRCEYVLGGGGPL